MNLPGLPRGLQALLLGASAIVSPDSINYLLNDPLNDAGKRAVQLFGLVSLQVGVSQLFWQSENQTLKRVQAVFDAFISAFCICFWLFGVVSVLCLTYGLLLIPNTFDLLKGPIASVCRPPKDIYYDLQKKKRFMEKDTKIKMNLIVGRVWTYVYDVTAKNKNFIQHMDIMTNLLQSRFNLRFPWNGGRIYDQDASANIAVIEGDRCFVMSSSGYCAMSQQKDVLEYAIDQTRKAGPNFGSYAVIGFNEQVNLLHRTLERYYQRDAAMVAASGYLACMNIIDFLINSLGVSGDKSLVLMDRYSHPCLRQGAHEADKVCYFRHNDAEHAREFLRKYKHYQNRIVVIESVYSTDGDIGDLPAFRAVCDEFQCKLVVDDAHGLGVLGPNAGGVEDYWNMRGAADYICGTFSKSCSSQGGYVVSNDTTLIGALVMSPGVGFATAMNAFSAAFATKALEYIMNNGKQQVVEARELRAYMREKIIQRFDLPVDDNPTRLLTIRLMHPTRAMHVQKEMQRCGFLISAMSFPAVPMHQSLLRMTIIPGILTREIIDKFCDALGTALQKTEKLSSATNTHLLYNSSKESMEAWQKIEKRKAAGLYS